MLVSCCERADLDEVVGEHAVSASRSGAVDAGEFGAVPSVAAFDVVDSAFGSGPPFDLLAEGSSVFELPLHELGVRRVAIPRTSKPSAARRYPHAGAGSAALGGTTGPLDRREVAAARAAEPGSGPGRGASSASTRPNSTGNTNSSGGRIASHNVDWSFTVLSTMASIPSSPRG